MSPQSAERIRTSEDRPKRSKSQRVLFGVTTATFACHQDEVGRSLVYSLVYMSSHSSHRPNESSNHLASHSQAFATNRNLEVWAALCYKEIFIFSFRYASAPYVIA